MVIKAIIFDVNGVLEGYKYSLFLLKRHSHRSVHEYVARSLNINLDKWFDAIDTPYAQAIEGKISKKTELNIISKNLGISAKHLEKVWVKSYRMHFKRNNALFQYAYKLQNNGYLIAMLSDQHPVSKEVILSKLDVNKFNATFFSCDVGLRKPNLKFYKHALKKLKIKPHESVFIDDRPWNTKPAKKLGMNTILFQNNRQTIRDLNKLGICL